jgi:predicted RNA binding protein YcfA (HicA-like mRNA interferase family)
MKVREVIQILEREGWRLDRQTGSHRQFRHRDRPGTVTVAGKPTDEVPRGTLASIWRQAGRSGREERD